MEAKHPRFDIGCVGDVCVDLVLTGDVVPRFGQVEQLIDDYALELGGSGVLFASQFAKLGGNIVLVGSVGTDPFGRFVEEQIEAIGVDTSHVRRRSDLKTGLSVSLSKEDGDRSILTLLGTIDATRPSDLTDDLLNACRHWHLASFFLLESLRDFWPKWLDRCRAAGMTVSLDTNWDPENRWAGVTELLSRVDVFLPNEEEAKAISGKSDVLEAARHLAEFVPTVVVKRGEEGAIAVRGSEVWTFRPPEPATEIADTIGAGDNFDAGFLRAWLRGDPIEACLQLGHRCGFASLSQPGGIRGQLRESQV